MGAGLGKVRVSGWTHRGRVQTITEYVLASAHRHPDRIAVIEAETERALTYRQLVAAVERARSVLWAAGLRPGHTVGLVAPNGVDYPVAFHAAASLGAVVTTLNPQWTVSELAHPLRDSGATLVLAGPDHLDHARDAAQGSAVTRTLDTSELFLAPADAGAPPTHTDSSSIAALPYSSGTTGLPKGVMLSHANLVAQLRGCASAEPYGDGEVALAALPFFHIFGLQVILNNVLAQGGTLVTMRRFDLEAALSAIETYRIGRLYAVPPIVAALSQHPAVERFDLTSLRSTVCGAAPLSAELARRAARRLGCPVLQGYGMTELAGATHFATPDTPAESCGPAMPGIECRIADAGGAQLPPGTEGEVWIRGAQVMVGYHGRPDATVEMLDADGWLHTGDIGRLDLDGGLVIVDRIKELIKCSGFQVAPAELEAILTTHQAVADAAVIGVPDPAADEVPKAFVVLKDGCTADAEDIAEFVNSRVSRYKRIRQVEFVDTLPRNPSGKLLRRQLRSRPAASPATGTDRWDVEAEAEPARDRSERILLRQPVAQG